MGGGQSAPKVDYSTAHFDAGEVQRQILASAQKAKESAWGSAKMIIFSILAVLVLGGIATGVYYWLRVEPDLSKKLTFNSATFGGLDYTAAINNKVNGDSIFLATGLSSLAGVTGSSTTDQLSYQFTGDAAPTIAPISSLTEEIDISLANRQEHFSNKVVSQSSKSKPTSWTKLSSVFNMSGNSGDQLPYSKDATSMSSVPSGNAPLSDGADGGYGMQFWMYIKDWNTNFGKEKHVLSRSDVTNNSIMNPNITLHPTENTMRVSISVFPTDTSSKLEPAPAGHAGSTDDVFMCEVPDIPLQSWVSVSLTVFSRNLDIYINGKLVKSCLLSGVPKKALGDIIMNKNGGFSGYVCGFYHYPRMLVPADAQAFFSAGTSCSASTAQSTLAQATGYGVKFGLYDATGKVINQYVF